MGRPALIPLSPPPTLGDDGAPVGEVARWFHRWITSRKSTDDIRSGRTADGYWADMRRWATLLAPPGDGPAIDRLRLVDLTRDNVEDALAAMNDAGLSTSARKRSLAPLRGLCGWLARRGVIEVDPIGDFSVKTAGKRLPKAFTDDEMRRIYSAAAVEDPTQRADLRWPARDRAVVAVLAGCGVRASELCGLAIADLIDFDGDEPLLRVIGKGDKERAVPLTPRVVGDLAEYLGERIDRSEGDERLRVALDAPLFVRTDGSAVSPSVLNEWVIRWCRSAGVTKPVGAAAHAFRHTAADGMLAGGASLNEVQAVLGHANISTTSVYVAARAEASRAALRHGRFEQI